MYIVRLRHPKYTQDGRQSGWWTVVQESYEHKIDALQRKAELETRIDYSEKVTIRKEK